MLGADEAALLARLREERVPAETARRAIASAKRAPAHAPGRAIGNSSRRLLMILGMLRELRAAAGSGAQIERRPKPPAEEFFQRYFATSTPVVFTDAQRGWKARRRWNARYFERAYGHLDIEVTADRNLDPDYDMHTREHSRIVKMAEFARRVAGARRATNDFYMVANNHAMERSGMEALLGDVVMDPTYFDPAHVRGAVSLWFGPGGTVTPLHHDTTNIVLHQVWGKKRILLVSPFETALLGKARGFYCDCDPEHPERHPELTGVPIPEVELAPGDALFLPVGWWHHVRALSPSISISFTNLRVPNNYSWYTPGKIV